MPIGFAWSQLDMEPDLIQPHKKVDVQDYLRCLPEMRHLAAPLAGQLGCFRFWECRSLGGWEVLATKNTKPHKESARPAPKGVQWFHVHGCEK